MPALRMNGHSRRCRHQIISSQSYSAVASRGTSPVLTSQFDFFSPVRLAWRPSPFTLTSMRSW